MKSTRPRLHSRILAGSIAALALLALPQMAHAGLYYWDVNGNTAGYGTAGGTWGSDANWSTDDSGTVTTTAYTTTTSDGINFGAGVTGLGAGTVAVTGTQNAGALTFASGSGAIVLSGGTAINLAATSSIIVNNATDTISTKLTGATSLTKTGTGTLILSGANDCTGDTIIGAGTLQVGDGSTGSLNGTSGTALTFTATSTFNVKEAASSTQGMGVLSFSRGEGNVYSTAAGASSTATLTFGSMVLRPAGATANFNIVTNTSSTGATPNKIVVTTPGSTVPLSSGSNNPGIFFNLNDGGTTANYARYDSTGYIRGTNYGVDTNSQTSLTSPTPTSSTDLYLASGGAAGGITANTIRVTGADLTVAASTTLTVNGILLVGTTTRNVGSSGVGNGSSIRPTVDGGEVVIASQATGTSLLRVYPNIVDRGGLPTKVTKAGIGQIVVGTAKDYTGVTTINSGLFRSLIWADAGTASGLGKGSGGTTPVAADIVISGGTLNYGNATPNVTTNRLFTIAPAGATLDCSGNSAPGCGNWIIGSAGGNIGFTDSNQPATLTLANNAPSAAYFGIGTLGAALGNPGSGANVTSVIKTGASGTWELAGANSYTGNTTISAGILTLTSTGTLKFAPGANDVCNKVTGPGTANFNGTFNIDTTSADTTNGNGWTLVDVTTKTYGGTFAVTGFTNSSGVWTKVDGTKTWTFTQSTGVLGLVNSGGTTYTVTFNNNGGSGTMTAQTGSSAAALTSNTFTRSNYTFAGWNTASNGLGTAYADGASYPFTANNTMYAQWTGNSYTVTFDGNGGGTPSPTSMSVTYGLTYGTLATVARTGYTFNGWFTATSGGTQVTSGSTVAITGAQTLYAQWTINNYTVSFNMNGGSPTISSQSVSYNTTATQPSDPTKASNAFAGWYSDAGLTTSFSFATAITADTTLYAKWTPVVTYTVSFNMNGGTPTITSQDVVTGSTATQPSAPTKTGYTFGGWYSDAGLTTSFSFSTAIAADTALYAKWTGVPAIVLADTLGAVNTTYGTASATPTSFHVSGDNLTGNLTVTPPTGYEVSLSSGSSYSSTSVSITASGTLASTQVYVRLAAASGVASSPYTGNVTVSGGGASSQTIATASSSVAKADATVVVTPYTVGYDGSAHSATVASITGVNGETGATVGTVTLNTTHMSAGTYASDTWSFAGSANYNNIGISTTTITVANPSFETTASGPGAPWFKFGTPWSITSSPSVYQVIQAVAGGSFNSTCPGGGTYIGLINEDDCPITAPLVQNLNTTVTAGDTLSVTFYIGRQLGAAAGGAGVAYFDVAGTKYTMAFDTSAMTAGTWQLATFTQTITNSGNLSLGFYGTSAHTINAWIDKISDVSRTSGSGSQTLTDTINMAGSSVTAPTVGTYTYNGSPQGPNSGASATGSTGAVSYSYSGTSYGPSATQPTNAGSYTVTATVAADSNHNSASSSATAFSIGKASQSISFSLAAVVAKSAGSVSLAGTASSGLTVSYVSSAPAIASVSGTTLTLHQGGSVTVTASQTGDDNYTAATAVPQTTLITGFTAVDEAVNRPANSSGIKIPVAILLANDGQMGSNDTVTPGTGLTITGVTAGTGNSVRVSGAFVFFTPNTPAASDPTTFTYTVSDGSSTATATVTVSTVDATPFTLDLLRVVSPAAYNGTSTSVTVEFAGVASQTYQIEYSTGLDIWSAPQAVETGSTGTFEATFTKDGNQLPAWNSLFFRASR